MDRIYKGKKINDSLDEYVVVDIETTGLSPQNNKIIEIAALKIQDGKVKEKFQKLVNPGERVPPFITRLTGITNNMLEDAEHIDCVIEKFEEFIGENVIVGHNVNFDLNFLYDNLYNTKGKYLSNNYLDTMYMGRRLVPGLPNYKLCSLTEHFEVGYENAHRALNDCMFTYRCYEKMKEMI